MIRDLADGRQPLRRARALARGHLAADPEPAPALARGGGHRRPPDLPRGPAARRVRADREGPRARPDHRVDARVRHRVARRHRQCSRAAGAGDARSRSSREQSVSGLQLRVRARGARPAAQNPQRMHNRALHDTLAAFVEEAAWQLAEEVAAGAEVPFELIEQGRASAPLYCYRPLTDRFIAEHLGMLERLPSYPAARKGLAALPNLGAYLIARGRRAPAGDRRAQGDAALEAFITALWGDATDFVYDARALRPGLRRARGGGLRRLLAVGRARARRGPRDRQRGGRARRRPRARPRHARSSTPRPTCTATTTRRSPSCTSSPRPASRRRSSRPAAACAGCRPRCGCGTTPSRRSPRSPGPAPTAARGCRSRSPPACAAWTATACSRPRRRTRCARSAP